MHMRALGKGAGRNLAALSQERLVGAFEPFLALPCLAVPRLRALRCHGSGLQKRAALRSSLWLLIAQGPPLLRRLR